MMFIDVVLVGAGLVIPVRIVGGQVARPGEYPWMVVLGKPGSFGGTFQVRQVFFAHFQVLCTSTIS